MVNVVRVSMCVKQQQSHLYGTVCMVHIFLAMQLLLWCNKVIYSMLQRKSQHFTHSSSTDWTEMVPSASSSVSH